MNNQLSRRIVLYLIVAQLSAFCVAWGVTIGLGLLGVELFATSLDELASARTIGLVANSLVSDQEGNLTLQPSASLRAEMARVPPLRFAVFDSAESPISGSSPELIKALSGILSISPRHTHFKVPSDPVDTPLGYLGSWDTRFGKVFVAVYHEKFVWSDVFYTLREDLRWLSAYLLAAILTSIVAAWIAVQKALRPVLEVAAKTQGINVNALDQRLSIVGVPNEILPLVTSVNSLLDRLNSKFTQQRRFTANAAHELRTPIAILNARLEAPMGPLLKADLRRDARRLKHIVEQLIAAARLGETPSVLEDVVDIVDIARSVANDAALLALRSGRDLVFEAPEEPIHVFGNRAAIEAILNNLLDNALRFEPPGGTVIISVYIDGLVSIVDHGPGIGDGEEDLIFEPFWRRDQSASGIGLGLAISKELVEAVGGVIWIEKSAGVGATFNLLFRCSTDAVRHPGPS